MIVSLATAELIKEGTAFELAESIEALSGYNIRAVISAPAMLALTALDDEIARVHGALHDLPPAERPGCRRRDPEHSPQ